MLKEDSIHLVTYCGLYCGSCAQHNRVPQQAEDLGKTLHEEGFDDFYQYVPEMKESYPPFKRFLENLARFD